MARFKPNVNDVAGIDLDPSGTPIVRIRRAEAGFALIGADIMPGALSSIEDDTDKPQPLEVPPKLRAKFGAIAVGSSKAVVKLVSLPGQMDAASENKLVDALGLDNPETYRIGHKPITEGHNRSESRVLVAAIPEAMAARVPRLLPSGFPVPHAMEVSDLAILTAFIHAQQSTPVNGGQVLIHFGNAGTVYAIFSKTNLALVRRFDVGTSALLGRIQDSYGVDENTAKGMLSDSAFDISNLVKDLLDPLTKQMVMGRDFVERRENCRTEKVFASGDLASSPNALAELHSALGVKIATWDPFAAVKDGRDNLSAEHGKQSWRFAAALGAAIAAIEET
jgi:Tfp pilus assembly PilM family ATPase